MKIRILHLLLSTFLLFAMLPALANAEDKPVFSLSSSINEAVIGNEVTITVEGQNVSDAYGFEVRLSYDPTVLTFLQATTTWSGFTVPAIVESGSLTFAHTKVGRTKGENGHVRFASVRFQVIGQGDADIRLTRVKLVDSETGSTTAEPDFLLKVSTPVKEEADYYVDTKGHWAEKEIARATEQGWITGYPDGRFAPQEEVTRAQFTTMLSRALALSASSEAIHTFQDDDQIPAYAKPHIQRTAAAGLIRGYEDGTFRPSRWINRSEITVMLMRVLGYEDDRESSLPLTYADADLIPQWAYPAVAAATDKGIVQGRSANLFAPGGDTTRAEAVTLILRLLDHK
ncbi:S-layer homology domain-containing protein [Paenibacillus sp. 1P07SE]|uniref:S-layer homology domain-containing protein n=1 Tax=Paenibacillus sp. 1P07SE TaxID=3132209 RepID=UPI0039A6A252